MYINVVFMVIFCVRGTGRNVNFLIYMTIDRPHVNERAQLTQLKEIPYLRTTWQLASLINILL